MLFPGKRIQLEMITVSELNQFQKEKYCAFLSFLVLRFHIDTYSHACICDLRVGVRPSRGQRDCRGGGGGGRQKGGGDI